MNRLALLRQIERREFFPAEDAAICSAIVDVRVATNKARRSIRIERVRDGFEIDKFAIDSRKVKRSKWREGKPQTRMSKPR